VRGCTVCTPVELRRVTGEIVLRRIAGDEVWGKLFEPVEKRRG